MNIVSTVMPVVTTVVNSEATKAVVGFAKPIVKAGLKGIQRGAVFGAGFVTFGYGAKLAYKGMPKVLDPIVELFDAMSNGDNPILNITVNVPEKTEEEKPAEEIKVNDEPAEDQK